MVLSINRMEKDRLTENEINTITAEINNDDLPKEIFKMLAKDGIDPGFLIHEIVTTLYG